VKTFAPIRTMMRGGRVAVQPHLRALRATTCNVCALPSDSGDTLMNFRFKAWQCAAHGVVLMCAMLCI